MAEEFKERTIVIPLKEVFGSLAARKEAEVLCYDKLSAKELLYGQKILVLETAARNLNDFYGAN